MKKFITYTLLFLSPFILFYLPYFIGDPFKILRHYDIYYPVDGSPLRFNNNRTYVSTMMYVQNKDRYNWDSFIFGSSRSGYFMVDHWKRYIGESSKCFHFDGYGESLYNIYIKMKYIDGKSEIKHALICLDESVLFQDKPETAHLCIPAPILEDNSNWSQFQMAGLKAYSNFYFFLTYLDFSLNHKVRQYMIDNGTISISPFEYYDKTSNECHKTLPLPYSYDSDSLYYTATIMKQFYDRPDSTHHCQSVLKSNNIRLLEKIKDILEKNHTDYKIILNPNYDQLKLSNEDMTILQHLFTNHIFDFSGRNKFTEDYRNYGDVEHFRQHIAAEIMQIIYEKDDIKRNSMLDSLYNL